MESHNIMSSQDKEKKEKEKEYGRFGRIVKKEKVTYPPEFTIHDIIRRRFTREDKILLDRCTEWLGNFYNEEYYKRKKPTWKRCDCCKLWIFSPNGVLRCANCIANCEIRCGDPYMYLRDKEEYPIDYTPIIAYLEKKYKNRDN